MNARLFLILACFVCLVSGQALAGSTACPLVTPGAYTAAVVNSRLEARVGEPLVLSVRLTPEKPPVGFFVTVLIDEQSAPANAKVHTLSGFPDSKVTVDKPGRYMFTVRVNLIAKSSCGGVKARVLSEEPVTIDAVAAQPSSTEQQ